MEADRGRAQARRALAATSVLLVLAGLMAADAGLVSAAGPAANGDVAFVSDRDGDPEIFVVDPAGGEPERLTENEAWDTDPAWSPDGTRLAVSSNRDGDDDIYILDATGTGAAVNLTDDESGRDTQPDWSPNGKRIVFVRDGDLFRVEVEGGSPLRLTRGHDPAWAPDGSRIAFVRSDDLYSMNPDGSDAHVILPNAAPFGVDWSPDASQIVFAANGLSDDGGFHIYLANADGTNAHPLTSDEIAEDFSPAFSPDGTTIAFTRIGVDAEVMTIGADGSGLAPLVSGTAYDFEPHWAVCTTACPTPSGSSSSPQVTPSTSPTTIREATTLSLSVVKGARKVKVAGRLRPAHEGSVHVKLQVRKGRWVTKATKNVALDDVGGYRARFRRRHQTACRVVARWPGDEDHLPSVARDRFRC